MKKKIFCFFFLILLISWASAFSASNASYSIRGNIAQGGDDASNANYSIRFFIPEQPCKRVANNDYNLFLCYYFDYEGGTPTQPLSVSLTANPNSGCDPLDVNLTATVTGGTAPFTYQWDYNSDGITDYNKTTSSTTDINKHTYTPAGDYNATVKVKDSSMPQQNAQATKAIVVNSCPPANNPPTVEAKGPYSGLVGQIIAIDGNAFDTDGTISDINWTIAPAGCTFGAQTKTGVGTAKATNTSTVTCISPINSTITLKATDNNGASSTDTAVLNVSSPANNPPTVNAGGPYSGLTNQKILISGTAQDSDGTIFDINWVNTPAGCSYGTQTKTGIGTASASNNSDVNCTAPGNYQIKLRATDDDGAIGEGLADLTVTVAGNTPPVVNCSLTSPIPPNGIEGVTTFTANASASTDDKTPPNPLSYCFDWEGDGLCDGPFGSSALQTHIYPLSGTYDAYAYVRDTEGGTGKGPCGIVNVSTTAQAENLLWLQKLTIFPSKVKKGVAGENQITFTATVRNLSPSAAATARVRFYFSDERGNKIIAIPDIIRPDQPIAPQSTTEFSYTYAVTSADPLQMKNNYYINVVVEAVLPSTEDPGQLFDNEKRKIFSVIEIRAIQTPEMNEALIPVILLVITIILLKK